ncbi:ABC transporter ATP-binding protein (plasmid) [Rhizobium rhizogenes]|uniref:ABC transporter ATP-binding protein n=1 Tax=Rhizobium rhizogenes TaxID=359 RepID=UPI001572987E|nr:ABC transporter ATP-binding protein [Rhizobium rhizogenes]NTI26605.1 ABC transporter ATP-binding protein [Rhizobium rhizogenes]QTG10209.1 ABC transporter ATP-binding protein [Rhizobium rhizogenes]
MSNDEMSKPAKPRQTAVELVDVCKVFDTSVTPPAYAVDHLSLKIASGEFFTFLGPSGCGKTTTLRMIAGFERPSAGEILLDGRDVSGLPAHLRNTNTVFQSYALFPHLSVEDNVAFGLSVKRVPRSERNDRVAAALDLVRMRHAAGRKPSQLSGGQQQRIALARALVNEPSVLLLDEPFGALDLKLRREMQIEVKEMQRRLGITFIFVTHDQEEALTMSDRIAVMSAGVIQQVDDPVGIYERPADRFTASFIGDMNMLPAKVLERQDDVVEVLAAETRLKLKCTAGLAVSADCTVAMRPEALTFTRRDADDVVFTGQIESDVYVGVDRLYSIRLNGGAAIVARVRNTRDQRVLCSGETVNMFCPASAIHLLCDQDRR